MEIKSISKATIWTSRILQILLSLLFLIGAINNIFQTEMAVSGAVEMGFPKESVFYLGVILLVSTVLYIIPNTSFLGAIFLTGWLGGAVATHVIHGDPIINIIFPVIFALLIWGCLWLRNVTFRQLLKGK